MINFSPIIFLKIKQTLPLHFINHFFTLIISFSFLIISCSSTKRFTSEESEETINVNPKVSYSSVRVLLEESDETYFLTVLSPVYLYNSTERLAYIAAGNIIECKNDFNGIRINIQDKNFYEDSFFIKPGENNVSVIFNGKGYKGEIVLRKIGGSIGIINHLKIEDYIKGVVAEEMPVGKNSENFEGLKAFSFCVRTYTLKKIAEGKSLYDLYDDTRDQVYGGFDSEQSLSNEAVDETENKILMYNGNIATIYYHSTCGGFTEAANNIFTAKEIPYLMGVSDGKEPNCKISPRFEWKETYSEVEIINRLKRASLTKSNKYKISDLFVESRFSSGRIKELVFELIDDYGEEKIISIHSNEIRSVLRTSDNKRILWSTLFDITKDNDKIVITGKGFGHGVGMCQWGAISLSKSGWSYENILEHYFPGTEIKVLND